MHLAREGPVNPDPLAGTSTDLLIRHPCKLTGDSAGSKETSGGPRAQGVTARRPPPTFGRIYIYFFRCYTRQAQYGTCKYHTQYSSP